tara:strand:- start:37 stop:744 length:708 start_codon:yes stop_codon:yes gene_type:complete
MNTQTKFNLPIGFYTTFHTRNRFNQKNEHYCTIELIKVNDKTITIKQCGNHSKAITRKPKLGISGYFFELENASTMGRWSPIIFDFTESYYTKHKPSQEELEKDFVKGEIIFNTEKPKKKNTNQEVFDTLNYLINNNFAKEYDDMYDKKYWMTIEGTDEVYTKIMNLQTNIKSVINLQNELKKLTKIIECDGTCMYDNDTIVEEKDIKIFYEIEGDNDIYKMIKKCLGKHYKPVN